MGLIKNWSVFQFFSMGFFNSIFGNGTPVSEDEKKEQEAQRQYDLLRDTGVRALRAHELPTAIDCLNQAHLMRPDDAETLSYLVEALLQKQDFEQALPLLKKLADAETENLEVSLLLAQTQGRLKRYDEMAATMMPLMATHADDARVFRLAAEAAHGQHNDIMAIAWLTQALALREDDVNARLLRARVLKGMGQWNEVLTDTTVITTAHQDIEEAWMLHGEALAANGKSEEAAEAFRHVVGLNPFSADAYLLLAETLEAAGQQQEALNACNEAIEQMPELAEAYKLRGGIKLRLHDELGAADDLKKALQIKPELAQGLEGAFSNMDNYKG